MIVRPDIAARCLSGEVRAIPRPFRPGDTVVALKEPGDSDLRLVEVWRNERRWLRVGKTMAIQPGRTRAVGHVVIEGLDEIPILEVTDQDAKAMGYRDRPAFLAAWLDICGGVEAFDPLGRLVVLHVRPVGLN